MRMITVLIPPVVLAMAGLVAADEVVLRETFARPDASALPDGWSTDGPGWSIKDGSLYGAALHAEKTILVNGDSWRDVALAADVRFVEARDPARWFALLLRDAGPDRPGIQFTIRRDTERRNGLELAARRAKSDGGGWRVLQTASRPRDNNDGALHVRIEARGDWIRAFIDRDKVFECPRASAVSPTGRIGFRVNGATIRVDNVEVSRLDPTRPAELRHLRARPLIIAHRGFSYNAPENTLAAYRAAIEVGADMAECDVWLSADGVPVLLHDQNLKRTTGLDAPVTGVPLAKIKELDAGRWKSPEYTGERIPTLNETLRLVKGKVRLIIEIKPAGMEREVITAIHEAGVNPADVMIFSFKHDVIRTMAAREPRLPTTWLIGEMPWGESERRETLAEALRARASVIGLPLTRVDPAIVHLAHESGFLVFVWTVNEPDDMRYLARIGVDGIITDRPDVLIHVLESPR
jgi:glycerophosphoryl diester phosphodiesterase